jgi:cytochrome c oxidase cbb3-type subunit 3
MRDRTASVIVLGCVLALTAGCQRERRVFDPGAIASQPVSTVQVTDLHAGQLGPPPPSYNQYATSADAVAEGKRLFSAYNCVGCHQHGGGGIGPALMDANWIYGSHPAQIHADIVQGRPNGMPSFAGKIPDYQVWEIVAYVLSMSGQLPSDIAPSRSDEMPVTKAEQAKSKEHPVDQSQQPVVQEQR